MFKRILFSILAAACTLCMTAQQQAAPKWAAKVQKAIFSLQTYDKDGNPLQSGTAFYVSDKGEAVADYALFKGAYSAIATDMKGGKSKVALIQGADDTYSMVRFTVDTKKSQPLTAKAASASAYSLNKGETVYVLPFMKEKIATCPVLSVTDTSSIQSKYGYYTLSDTIGQRYTSCPVFNEDGQLVAITQQPFRGKGYAIDINFKDELTPKAIASSSAALALNNIHIRKAIPNSAEEALVYLYFKSRTASNDEYIDMLNQFIALYPQNPEGYFRRITPYLDTHRFDDADKDLTTYLSLCDNKAAAYSNAADVIYTKLVYQPKPEYAKWTYDMALGYADKALGYEAKNEYKLQKAKILMAKDDCAAALAIYDEINSGKDRTAATFYAASLAHEKLGDSLSVQIALMDSAINMFGSPKPKEAANYVLYRAKLHEAAGQYRAAVIDYNDYSYLNNSNVTPAFYYQRYQLEVKARMYQQALDDINKAIEEAPSEPLYVIEKSGLQLRVNQIDECIATARKAIAMQDDMPDAYRILGYAQLQKGDNTSAKANLEKAVSLGDNSAQEIIDKYLK